MRSLADLRPYQNRVVTALYETTGLVAVLKMGAGKTVAALTAIDELIGDGLIRHGLVLAPKRVANMTWPAEIADWSHVHGMSYALLNGEPARRSRLLGDAGNRQLTIVGIDNTQWLCDELAKLPDEHPIFDLLVIDEISRFRSPKSKRAKALLKHVKRFKAIWGLTGTPRPSGYEDLFKPLAIVSREQLWGRSFYAWQKERFYPVDRNGYEWAIFPDREQQTIDEANRFMLTLSDADMPTLPPVNVIEHYVDMPEEVVREYKRMKRELVVELASGRDILAASAGVASGKMSQMAAGFIYGEGGNEDVEQLHDAKAEWIEELVEDLAGDPLLIIYEFIEDLRLLQRLFGAGLPYLGQGVTDRQAAIHIDAWNAGKLPLMALHAASGGHGLNLQFGGSEMAWLNLTWSSELYEQTVARIVRPGQTQKCFIHICLARGSVDEVKRMRVLHKMSLQEAFAVWLKKV